MNDPSVRSNEEYVEAEMPSLLFLFDIPTKTVCSFCAYGDHFLCQFTNHIACACFKEDHRGEPIVSRRDKKPEDYESNSEYAFDVGIDPADPDALHDCSLCQQGDHDGCQERRIALCKCFYSDHEESW